MSKIESVILGMFFGFVPLVFCLLTTLIITGILFGTEVIEAWALWSFVPGIIIDVIFLKKWVKMAYQMSNRILALLYLFYSVVGLGMGMGVPIFNFVLCIAAGVYIARRMHLTGADEERRNEAFKRTAVFCAAVMALMCCLITLWAIAGQMIGYRLETPLLSLTLTLPIFTAVVLTGGAVLVLLQYLLTSAAAKITSKLLDNKK
ncbi:MAG: hypothetical protein PVJ86_14145 [Phycisphaerales bacterium]|jgi:hypothetical protein